MVVPTQKISFTENYIHFKYILKLFRSWVSLCHNMWYYSHKTIFLFCAWKFRNGQASKALMFRCHTSNSLTFHPSPARRKRGLSNILPFLQPPFDPYRNSSTLLVPTNPLKDHAWLRSCIEIELVLLGQLQLGRLERTKIEFNIFAFRFLFPITYFASFLTIFFFWPIDLLYKTKNKVPHKKLPYVMYIYRYIKK